jgi:gamma-glutamyltranspeptidase
MLARGGNAVDAALLPSIAVVVEPCMNGVGDAFAIWVDASRCWLNASGAPRCGRRCFT